MPVDNDYIKTVRDALRHLYDTSALAENRLLGPGTGQPSGMSRIRELRQALLKAVDMLRPGSQLPNGCPDARAYRILDLRYIQGLSPNEAMAQLALQKSQFYQDHAHALCMVAECLATFEAYRPLMDEPKPTGAVSQAELIQEETSRVMTQTGTQEVDLARVIRQIIPVVLPLATEHNVSVSRRGSNRMLIEEASRTLLRQTIIGIVCELITECPGGSIVLTIREDVERRGVDIAAESEGHSLPFPETEMVTSWQQVIQTMGGALSIEQASPNTLTCYLDWPTAHAGERVLLVIDDNQEFAALYQRYLVGHGWIVVGATSLEEALSAASSSPHVLSAILLDILMPKQDGWEVLVGLQDNPRTANVPVIVCSVFDVRNLARSLGLADCLTKPIDEKTLVQSLARITD